MPEMNNAEDAVTFGQWVRQIRTRKPVMERNLAACIGIDDHYISRLDNGHVNPTLKTIEKLADALDIEVCAFFPSEKCPGKR